MWPWTGSPAGSRSQSEGTWRVRSAGFTLIEVLIAFVILALALAALLPGFASGVRSLDVTSEHVSAALLAESRLAAVGRETPLAEGTSSGELENGFRWRLEVSPLDQLDPEQALPVRGYQVVLTVSWGTPDGERSVTLETFRLGPPPPARRP